MKRIILITTMNLNKAIIIGNLTKDPELKALPSGASVCSFSVATNRTWFDKDKQKQESVEFHNIVVFGKMADNIAKYMKKGSQILVEGRIQTRTWEKDGKKNYRTEIVADNFQFGSKPQGTATPQKSTPTSQAAKQDPNDPVQIDESDIPF